MYVKIYNVCQRIKVLRHKLYKKLSFLSILKVSWKKIFMNFIIDLFLSKRDNVVYDLILIIINKYIKMIKYLSINIKINVSKLTNVFFEKIVLHFDMLTDIINDKDFLFINIFWSTFCYHAKIKRRFNTAFYF